MAGRRWHRLGLPLAVADLRAYLRKLGLIAPERTDQQIDGELQEQGDGLGLDDEDTPSGGKPSDS